MDLTPDQAAEAVEYHDCPKCGMPALKEGLDVAVAAGRGPGRMWTPGPPAATAAPQAPGNPIRIGYARCSTAGQELQSQLDTLEQADCRRVFSEKISTRFKVRPELEKALALAHDIKQAAPGRPVILTVHELKRLARNAAGLMVLSAQLQNAGIQLELLTGPLPASTTRAIARQISTPPRRCTATSPTTTS